MSVESTASAITAVMVSWLDEAENNFFVCSHTES